MAENHGTRSDNYPPARKWWADLGYWLCYVGGTAAIVSAISDDHTSTALWAAVSIMWCAWAQKADRDFWEMAGIAERALRQ